MGIGADVKNGLWAMYGACEGCYKTMVEEWDYVNVRDFTYLDNYWQDKKTSSNELENKIDEYHRELNFTLGLSSARLDSTQSKFFKYLNK